MQAGNSIQKNEVLMKWWILPLMLLLQGLGPVLGQEVTNVQAQQQGNKIIITYDLLHAPGGASFTVEAYLSSEYEQQGLRLNSVSGDVGPGVEAGEQKVIVWDVLRDVDQLEGEHISFVVRAIAEEGSALPLQGKQQPSIAGPEMVKVTGGRFRMGSRRGKGNEQPEHWVRLNDFYLSRYETTNEQYCDFLNAMGTHQQQGISWINLRESRIRLTNGRYRPQKGYERHPARALSWYGARAYCHWLGGRLPTEAEWEYAARGGRYEEDWLYSGSNKVQEVGWYEGNARGRPQQVGQKAPNALGLYDMSGNLWEWVYDVYDRHYYRHSPAYNPSGPDQEGYRVLRGGSFEVEKWYLRPTYRLRLHPKTATPVLGCRCAMDP